MFARNSLLSFVAILVLPLAAFAAEIRGVVTSVDANKQELTIETRGLGVRGMSMTFVLDKGAQVMMGQQAAGLGDLAPGKRVVLTYETKDGKNVAIRVEAGRLGALLGQLQTAGQGGGLLGQLQNAGQGGGLLGQLQAAGQGAAPAAAAAPADPNAVTGTLQRVAQTDREIVVVGPGPKGAETETTFSVPETVKITQGDKAIKFDDLKEGVRVAVHPEKRDGKKVAESIQILGEGGSTTQKPSRITQIRRVLQMADQILQMAEQQEKSGQP